MIFGEGRTPENSFFLVGGVRLLPIDPAEVDLCHETLPEGFPDRYFHISNGDGVSFDYIDFGEVDEERPMYPHELRFRESLL